MIRNLVKFCPTAYLVTLKILNLGRLSFRQPSVSLHQILFESIDEAHPQNTLYSSQIGA